MEAAVLGVQRPRKVPGEACPRGNFAGLGRRNRRILLPALLAAAGLLLLGVAGGGFVAPGRPGKRPGSGPRDARTSVPCGAGEQPATDQLWSLVVTRTDHYVWRDQDVFVGIVADAGEWTADIEAIRGAFEEANSQGSAEVFSAPLYVVKDYVKELRNYGLAAEARKVEAAAQGGEGSWRRRDWKELPPELKEIAEQSRQEAEAESSGASKTIVIVKSDHAVFEGGRHAEMKFRAYVEMASDAAKRFAPDEAELNACYARIRGSSGRSPVLRSLTSEAAESAIAQLRKAGFVVELEEEGVKAGGA